MATLLVLMFAAWSAAQPEALPGGEQVDQAALRDALGRWTSVPAARAHATLDHVPPPGERDWMRALRRAGTPLTWESRDIPPLAIEVAPIADPRGGVTIWLVAAEGQRVAVSDAMATLDTVVAQRGGAMLRTPIAVSPFMARIGEHIASTALRDTTVARRVMVIGRATWEAKFVITALEEAGWGIDARLAIAPGVEVTQGTTGAADIARHAAVVVLDAPSPGVSAALTRYARSGGGVILAGESAGSAALATLATGRLSARVRPASVTFVDDAPRRALPFRAIVARSDAVVLEEQGDRVAIAGRRVDHGRVIQMAYVDTWRWRLAGGAGAVDAHREWWRGLVSAVAHRATVPVTPRAPNDPAPLASLMTALGPPQAPAAAQPGRARWAPSTRLLFTLIMALLLAEIASRRLRGAP